MTLLFMRHGVTEYNRVGKLQGRKDFPLSEEGRNQVLSVELKQLAHVEKIYSSPLMRAQESARLLKLSVPLVLDQRLVERGFGCFEGRTFEELYGHGFDLQRAYEEDEYQFYDVESLGSMKKRLGEFVNSVKSMPEETILVLSHGALGLCLRQMFPQKKSDIQDLADIKNCQILPFDL